MFKRIFVLVFVFIGVGCGSGGGGGGSDTPTIPQVEGVYSFGLTAFTSENCTVGGSLLHPVEHIITLSQNGNEIEVTKVTDKLGNRVTRMNYTNSGMKGNINEEGHVILNGTQTGKKMTNDIETDYGYHYTIAANFGGSGWYGEFTYTVTGVDAAQQRLNALLGLAVPYFSCTYKATFDGYKHN